MSKHYTAMELFTFPDYPVILIRSRVVNSYSLSRKVNDLARVQL